MTHPMLTWALAHGSKEVELPVPGEKVVLVLAPDDPMPIPNSAIAFRSTSDGQDASVGYLYEMQNDCRGRFAYLVTNMRLEKDGVWRHDPEVFGVGGVAGTYLTLETATQKMHESAEQYFGPIQQLADVRGIAATHGKGCGQADRKEGRDYYGTVLGETKNYVVQGIGRGAVWHDKAHMRMDTLDKAAPGTLVHITYDCNHKGVVKVAKTQDRGAALSRA